MSTSVNQMNESEEKKQQKTDKPEKGARNAPGPRKRARLVGRMLKDFEKKLEVEGCKMSIADFIRLLQIEKELKDEAPKEIRVTWVEPAEKEPASGA
ncbi:MAG: hypothetical protein ABFD60_18025 [Bryobacteraceae bacterium]